VSQLKRGDTFVETSDPFFVYLVVDTQEVFAFALEDWIDFGREEFDEQVHRVDLDITVKMLS
jgi:hypothetical protein